jgi:prophage antirepressor-like protein
MKPVELKFEDVTCSVYPTNDSRQWFMTLQEVAEGYGVRKQTVHTHLEDHRDELGEYVLNKGVGITDTFGGPQKQTIIYREGVIKLGFFIRSKRAKAFRQWATEVICDHLDASGLDLKDVLLKMDSRLSGLEEGQESLKGICSGLRDEVDELKAMVNFVYSDKDEEEVRDLIRRIKKELGMDGRAIVGHVRKTLNIGSIYDASDMRAVKNVLRNLLGEGLRLVQSEDQEVT